jgi:hypothetical protein
MDEQRRRLEEQVIAHYMGSNTRLYQFYDLGTSRPYLRMAAKTNTGNVYVLRLEMPNYPNSKPNAYVECLLRDCHGNKMDGASSSNHTLDCHPSMGWTQICHYHPSAWRPDMSLWMVYVRCVLWLNIYEKTLRSGKDMEYYLKHMGSDYES